MSPERVRELRVAWSTVRQSTCLKQRVTRRKIIVGVFAAMAALLLTYQRGSSSIAVSEPQVRRQQRRIRPRPATQVRSKADINSAFFKHETHRVPKTKLTCSNCHTVITSEAPAEIAAGAKPSIKGYPYHDKCLDCHRATPPQFFRGTTPVICAVCHTRSSARMTKDDMNTFPKQTSQTILGDLSLKFDHESASHRRECTTCHINIAQLDIAKADASISNCASSACHRKPNVKPGFDQEMLLLEDDDIAGGKNGHSCLGCHSKSIGGTPPPCSHYKLFDVDHTYFNSTDFPKGAKLISAQCK